MACPDITDLEAREGKSIGEEGASAHDHDARKQCASTQLRTHPEIGKMIRDLFDDPMPILFWPVNPLQRGEPRDLVPIDLDRGAGWIDSGMGLVLWLSKTCRLSGADAFHF